MQAARQLGLLHTYSGPRQVDGAVLGPGSASSLPGHPHPSTRVFQQRIEVLRVSPTSRMCVVLGLETRMVVSSSFLEEINEARDNLRTVFLMQLRPRFLAWGLAQWLLWERMNVSEAQGTSCSWRKVGHAPQSPFPDGSVWSTVWP